MCVCVYITYVICNYILHMYMYMYIYICTYTYEEEEEKEKTMAPHSSTLAWKILWTDFILAVVHGVVKSRT